MSSLSPGPGGSETASTAAGCQPIAGNLHAAGLSDELEHLGAYIATSEHEQHQRQHTTETAKTDSSAGHDGASSLSSRHSVTQASPLFVHSWTVEDVARWLLSHGLAHCVVAFKNHKITGDVLLDIGREELAEMGITALGDRMRAVKAIEQLRVDTKQVAGSAAGPSTLDFFFLGSSPLVTVTDGNAKSLEIIDLEAEQHAISKALVDSNRACRFQFEFATLQRLTWAVLQRSCTVLIFSGHTLPDGQWLLETETGEAVAFAPYELFQHEEAGAPRGSITLRLVVLCSCHSCVPASLFIDAGVPHVIAVERMETVLDVSARVFAQSLCTSLLTGSTIQNAFKHAQWLVKHNERLHTCGHRATARREAQKFVLLPTGGNHSTVLFPSQARGMAVDCSALRPPVQFPQTRLDLAIVRQVELWRVLRAVRTRRFVQVLGPPGVGKRTLVCLVAHYAWQRNLFPQGIHYIHAHDLRWVVALDRSLRRMFPRGDDEDSEAMRAAAADGASTCSWELYHESFLDHKLSLPGSRLLILDGCHALYLKCGGAFMAWLSCLLTENPGLQVLITARRSIREPVTLPALEEQHWSAGESIVEIGELSEPDANRLLRWRCHVLPEAETFLEKHGSRVVALCGRSPLALCVCARWLITQLPRVESSKSLLDSLEDDTKRLDVLKPCTLVFDTAISALPVAMQQALSDLAGLHAAFSAPIAAAIWGLELSEAEIQLDLLREHQLLEVTTDSHTPSFSVGCAMASAQSPRPSDAEAAQRVLFRMQPLLRQHLQRRHQAVESEESASVPVPLSRDVAARLLAGYAARIAGGQVGRAEFPNIQLALDLAGSSRCFLLILWCVRKTRWVHAWLGTKRRILLYERALAVLAALAESDPKASGARPQGRPAKPSELYLSIEPSEVPSDASLEAALHSMVEEPYVPWKNWDELENWIFCEGSNIDPAGVWGAACRNPSTELLKCEEQFEEQVLTQLSAGNQTASTAFLATLAEPAPLHRYICTALVELAISYRSSKPGRSVRLALCAVKRICEERSSRRGPSASGRPGDEDAELLLLLSDTLVEFALSCLALRGLVVRELTKDILRLAVSIGQRVDPLRPQHFQTLRIAALHALAFERSPRKSERLQKRCLELKLQKYNKWTHPDIAETLGDCGALCHLLGDLPHAESMLRTAVGIWRQLLQRCHPQLVGALADLANLLTAKDFAVGAEELYQEAISIQREAADSSQQLYQTMNRLARMHLQLGKAEVAMSVLKASVKGVQQSLGHSDHISIAALKHNYAQCLMSQIQGTTAGSGHEQSAVQEACEMLEEVSRIYKEQLPPSNASVLLSRQLHGQCLLLLDRPEEAATHLEQVLQTMVELGSYNVQQIGKVHWLLGRAKYQQGLLGECSPHYRWLMDRDSVMKALGPEQQAAVEEFFQEGKAGDPDEKPGGAARPGRGGCGGGGAEEEVLGGEPQREPEALDEGVVSYDSHVSFVDVDESSLSVLNRAQYLMAGRVKACLGVYPPLVDGHFGGAPPEGDAESAAGAEITLASGAEEEAALSSLLGRMEQECLKLPRLGRSVS